MAIISFTIHLSACLGGDHSFTIDLSAFLGGCSASSRGPGGRILAFVGGRSAPKTAGRGPTTRSLVFYELNHAGPGGRCMHIYSARQTADGRTADGRTHGRRQTDARTARTARTHARQTDARTRTAGADRLPDSLCFTTR